MRPYRLALAAACCVAASMAQAAGFRFIDVPADGDGPALTGAVWSPCASPAQDIQLRRLTTPGLLDCPIAGERLPLVVVSHGRRGWFGGHHDTAETLADAGFVVAAIDHPGDNSLDGSRSSDLSVFVERPADIKRLIDFMLGAWPEATRIDRQRIGFFGFSRGGYTGLVAVGGNPDFRRALALCPEGSTIRLCEQIRQNDGATQPVTHDPRIRAAVIVDPLAIFFGPDSFTGVTVPVQLWASARGGDGVSPEMVEAVERTLPANSDYHVVAEAGHFAFLAPCPAEVAKAVPEICTDAPGFDRVAFHKELNAGALAFFRKHLVDAETP
jgi:predicted dienelactone hydrolase